MNERLLENHLAFLRGHRGDVRATAIGYVVTSERPEFTYAVALRDGDVDGALTLVHRPEFGRASAASLEAQGFRRAGALRYMVRSTRSVTPPATSIRVAVARAREEADRFAEVQTAGFFDRDADRAEWLPFMRDAARRNVEDAAQVFFLATIGGVDAGVTLTVRTDVVGIYAVATPAPFRRRGVATALLDAALARAAADGCATAALQVAPGSEAERLYTGLGFEAAFTSEIWRRDAPR